VAEHAWTLKRAKQRLKTANPEDESNVPLAGTRNSLTMVGRMGIMFGGTSRDDTLNGCGNPLCASTPPSLRLRFILQR
jgi:hypothetical protein